MRKLSITPLLILIALFLWTHFASAAESQTSLPTTLPTKLPAKKKTVVVVQPISKKKKRVVVVETTEGLPKSLPAKTKVSINFDQPALPDAPAVVIRESAAPSMDEAEVQAIQHHELAEAPTLQLVGPQQSAPIEVTNQVPHALHQALPDSDSFVDLPTNLKRAPQQPTVAYPTAGVAPSKPLPVYVAPAPAPRVIVEAPAPEVVVAAPIAVQSTLPVELPQPTTSPQAVKDERTTVSSTSVAVGPELMGPPAPPVFDTTTQRTDLSPSERAEKPATLAVQTTLLAPRDEFANRRLFIRGGYLDAAYSKLESDLKNGATLFGVSASQVFSKTEVRLGIDVAHGLDQSITLRNTRMAMFRAEGLYNVAQASDFADFYLGAAVGLADIDVTSFRGQNQYGDVTVRENAKGDALLAEPEIGVRLHLSHIISFDVSLGYMLLSGGAPVSSLGGALAEAALGFTF